MRRILPVLLAVIGILCGGGAGYLLRPEGVASDAACEASHPCASDAGSASEEAAAPHGGQTPDSVEFVKLNNQFVVPDLQEGAVVSLTVLSLSIEVASGRTEEVFMVEPKLRDAFLQVLFDHANAGGFQGDFTTAGNMEALRRALLEPAQSILGPDVRSVLIADIMRQDM